MKISKRQLKRIVKEEIEELSDQGAIDKINELFRSKYSEQIITAIQMAWMMGLNPEDLEIYPLLPRDVQLGSGADHTNAARIIDAFFAGGPNWEKYIRNEAMKQVGSSRTDTHHFVPDYPNDPTKTSGSYEFREFDFLKTPASKLTPEMKAEIYSQAFITPLSKDTSWMSKVKNEGKSMKISKRQLKKIIKEEKQKLLYEANDRDTRELRQAIRRAMEAGFMKSVLMRIVTDEVEAYLKENPDDYEYTFASKDRYTKR